LAPLGIAIWLVTEDNRVLLQKKEPKGINKSVENLFQPIEGWVKSGESNLGGCVRLTKEELGEEFANKYPCSQLSQIKETKFPLRSRGEGTRCHFLGRLTPQQLKLITSSEKSEIKFVGKEDLSKIKKRGTISEDDDIILFEDDYEILHWLLEIQGGQKPTIFYF
jgi:hypothetical protein